MMATMGHVRTSGWTARPRTAWDSPWAFVAFVMATVAAFAILVMAIALHRQQRQLALMRALSTAIVTQQHASRVQHRVDGQQTRTIFALASLAKAQGDALERVVRNQASEFRILRGIARTQVVLK